VEEAENEITGKENVMGEGNGYAGISGKGREGK